MVIRNSRFHELWLNRFKHAKQKIFSNCEKFTLTVQTGSALARALLCLALLIEDLLGEGYHFVLTSKFQSDPSERRFGQYQEMNGGRFLVGLRDVTSFEEIIKIKSLLKEDLDIDNVKVENANDEQLVDCLVIQALRPVLQNILCCKEHWSENLVPENSDFSYLQILTIPSINLINYVCTAFVILDYSVDVIT